MQPDASEKAMGHAVSMRASVVDCRFETRLPSILSLLRAGVRHDVLIEVLAHRD
jgi:hypothetical protein